MFDRRLIQTRIHRKQKIESQYKISYDFVSRIIPEAASSNDFNVNKQIQSHLPILKILS